jgi:gluconate kinase
MKKIRYLILFAALFWIGLFQGTAFAYDDIIYIWQRNWEKHIHDSIEAVSGESESFAVLCGDLKFQDDMPSISTIDIEWSYLKGKKITLVFRMNTRAANLLERDSINTTVDAVSNTIKKVIDEAAGNQIIGVQFDYDCPTSKLNTYKDFIRLFRKRLPDAKISITSLPTWLNSREFDALIKETDYYVLQLHSFELPKTIEQLKEIFPNGRAKVYIKKASSFRHPYYISLPTYGYEVAFDGDGKFIGLRAESADILWGENIQHEVKMASVDEILDFLNYAKDDKPDFLKGICWFRLPIESDVFNWNIKTLMAVMQLKKPEKRLEVELSENNNGLIEIYLANTGEENFWKDVSFDIIWSGRQRPLYDALGGYKDKLIYENKIIRFSGPAPKVGEKVLISWLRVDKGNVVKSSEVVYENK